MIDVEKVRQRILDLAIRGKLVPQDPNDEPASVLLERIREEQIKLHREGKIMKLPEFSYIYRGSDNRYYEKKGGHDSLFAPKYPMPSSSESVWVKAEFVLLPMIRKTPCGERFSYLDINSIDNEHQIIRESKTIPTPQAPSRAARAVFSSSTLFSMVRPYLRNIAFVGEENKDCIASTGFFVATPNQKLFDPEFLYFILTSDYTVNGLNRYMKGDNSPSISADDVKAFALPLFSISYQNRCVSFIKKVNKILDKINENQKGLMKLSRVLKAKVLSTVFSSDKSYYEKIPICRCFETISTLNKEVKSKDVLEKGLYPVISQGQKDIDGYSNDKTKVIFDVPAILFGDHTRCVKLLRHPFIPGADGTKILRPLIDVEYLYFAMLYSVNTFASRGYGRHFALLKKTLIPQKDLMEQNAIAARLSRLFSLISDIR